MIHTAHLPISSPLHSAVTAKAQRQFAEDHTHIRMKEILHQDMGAGSASAFEGPFGARTI
jgi:hypothetical protein